jgi:hypothetical protein
MIQRLFRHLKSLMDREKSCKLLISAGLDFSLSLMVLLTPCNLKRPVDLLHQHQPKQLMGKGQF